MARANSYMASALTNTLRVTLRALKQEIPHFLQLTTAFITPIFQTFYFIKVGILCELDAILGLALYLNADSLFWRSSHVIQTLFSKRSTPGVNRLTVTCRSTVSSRCITSVSATLSRDWKP